MKTILVALNATYNHTNPAVRYLERYFNDKHGSKATCSLYVREFSINDDEESVLDTLIRDKGDIYAFSCYVWNIRYILDITSDLKKVMPDIRIILGGPEVMYEDHLF
ncbi:MAG: cobalamin-dependent protein, partial [Eubacteriales bacterium]|nr:cobalamin-dependent protein [Eubacteriales bacterium]